MNQLNQSIESIFYFISPSGICNVGQDDRIGYYPTALTNLDKFKNTMFYTNRWTSDKNKIKNKKDNKCPIVESTSCKPPCEKVDVYPGQKGCQKIIDICTCIDSVTQSAGLSTLLAYFAQYYSRSS
jgi:hypothetical protein